MCRTIFVFMKKLEGTIHGCREGTGYRVRGGAPFLCQRKLLTNGVKPSDVLHLWAHRANTKLEISDLSLKRFHAFVYGNIDFRFLKL